MKARLRWLWHRLNANYWLYPALFALAGAGLALGCVYLDRNGLADWINTLEWLAPARPQSASNMLTIIASSMIGVASTLFSITMVAVTFASSNYGPRLLNNFMEDKGNQLSLATFVGTFVYALMVLRTVRAEHESPASSSDALATSLPGFVPQLSLLVAYVLIVIAIGVLVYFLHHVPSSLRINTVIDGISQRLLESVNETYPQEGDGELPLERPRGAALNARKAGYVQLIDFETMAECMTNAGGRLVLHVRTGDFAIPGVPIAEVCECGLDDELEAALLDCFSLGASRTPEQDPQFLIDELVEIGLRALSPGINDPFTAITTLHWLGAAIADLGQRTLIKNLCANENQSIVPLRDDFSHFVQRGFGELRSGVAGSPTTAKVMLGVLNDIELSMRSQPRRARLREEAEMLLAQTRTELSGPSLVEVEACYVRLYKA